MVSEVQHLFAHCFSQHFCAAGDSFCCYTITWVLLLSRGLFDLRQTKQREADKESSVQSWGKACISLGSQNSAKVILSIWKGLFVPGLGCQCAIYCTALSGKEQRKGQHLLKLVNLMLQIAAGFRRKSRAGKGKSESTRTGMILSTVEKPLNSGFPVCWHLKCWNTILWVSSGMGCHRLAALPKLPDLLGLWDLQLLLQQYPW